MSADFFTDNDNSDSEEELLCKPVIDGINMHCREQSPYGLVRKLVFLIDNPMSTDQVSRQLHLLHQFLRTCSYAFWIRDVPFVIRLIEQLHERYRRIPEFKQPMTYLLCICATPPMLLKTSESFDVVNVIRDLFNLLGFLLTVSEDLAVRKRTYYTIKSLIKRNQKVGICCVSLDIVHKGMEMSDLSVLIVSIMEFVIDWRYANLVSLSIVIANLSHDACIQMVNEKMIDILLLRLIVNWDSRNQVQFHLPQLQEEYSHDKMQHFSQTTNLLWPLLHAVKKAPKTCILYKGPNQNALWSLRYALRILVKIQSLKLERNNLMALLLYLLELFPEMSFCQSGLPEDLCLLCGGTELGTGGTWASEFRMSGDNLDYNFKEMLLMSIHYCMKFGVLMPIIQRNVIKSLLRILVPEMTIQWNKQHYCKLITKAILILLEMLPLFAEEFVSNNGIERNTFLLELYASKGYDNYLLSKVLALTAKVLVMPGYHSREEMLSCNIVDTLVITADKVLKSERFTTLSQSCLKHAFRALELVLRKTEMVTKPAVDLCMKYIHRFIYASPEDVVRDPSVLICCLDFLWQLLIYTDENLKYFIESTGIYLLLDVIANCAFPVKIVALGIIVDCCEEGSCIAHLLTWRNTDHTFMTMLLKTFRDESQRLGVKCSEDFVIRDIETPLMGEQQFALSYDRDKHYNSCPCLMDMLGSCRPKIYAILQLFERYKEKVSMLNERYCISNVNYSVTDQNTKLIVDNFLPLKLGEAWIELYMDSNYLLSCILAVDRKTLDIMITKIKDWSLHLKTLQENLLKKDKYQQTKIEQKMYGFIKDSQLTISLDALHELNYIARTTESMFRFMKKLKQRIYLDELDVYNNTLAEYHPTFMYSINVTHIFNQKVKVESNEIIDPFAKPFDLELVSPRDEVVETLEPTCDNSLSMESLI